MFRVLFVLIILALSVTSGPSDCDSNFNVVMEGNVGKTSLFPWLGVLRVYLYEEDSYVVALTGIVYVKEGYAIGNADDVARIPKRIFKKDSEAVFIPTNQKPWSCSLVDYMTHPEYESTKNTIALLELDLGTETSFPMNPICWPLDPYRLDELYIIGFTDENKSLEKSFYAVQYLDQTVCQQFYNETDLQEKGLPTHWQCDYAKHIKEECSWENGMALASNSTGNWTLIGLGIRGPGCAAPARFIDIFPFLSWIDSATGEGGITDNQFEYRKSAFGEGFKNTRRKKNYYPEYTKTIGDCSAMNFDLIYNDEIKINSYQSGTFDYKIALHDAGHTKFECIKVYIKYTFKTKPGDDTIEYDFFRPLDKKSDTSFNEFAEAPESIMKSFPMPLINRKPKGSHDWSPGPELKVSFIEESYDAARYIENQTLYFHFFNLEIVPENEFEVSLAIFGPLKGKTSSTSSTSSSTTTEDPDEENRRMNVEYDEELWVKG